MQQKLILNKEVIVMDNYFEERTWVRARIFSYTDFIIDAMEGCKIEFDLDISKELAWDMVKLAVTEGHLDGISSSLEGISSTIQKNGI